MFRRLLPIAFVCAAPAFSVVQAQARTQTAPANNYLLRLTQDWGRESPLGDTRALQLAPNEIELRVWGGYGLTATTGIIIRHTNGAWRGWVAIEHRCSLAVPIPVGDTASAATAAAFRARARRECGRGDADTLSAASIFTVDTLELLEVRDPRKLERTWQAAVKAGVMALPPEIKRKWTMLDGLTYVVEIRRGDQYRASVIEHVERPESEADRQVQAVYRAASSLMQDILRRQR